MANSDASFSIDFAEELSERDSECRVTHETDSIMVCDENSSETVIKDLKGAVNVAHKHTKFLAEEVSLLKESNRQHDEAIHHLSEDQASLKHAIQNEVTPRMKQSDASINSLATRLGSLTTVLSSAVKTVEYTESMLSSIPTAHDPTSHDEEHDLESTACQLKISFTMEERLHKLESAIEHFEPRLVSVEKKLNKVLRLMDAHDAEEGDPTSFPMRDRTRALSKKNRPHGVHHHGAEIPRSVSVSSIASSGYGSVVGEDVHLSDLEEDAAEESIPEKLSA